METKHKLEEPNEANNSNHSLQQQLEKITTLLESQALSHKTVLSLDEVVLYTGLSKLYLYKLSSRNDIPFYKPGGKQLYFKKEEIDAWLLRNRESTNAEIEAEAINHTTSRKK